MKAIEADSDKISGSAFNVGASEENYQKQSLIDMILKQLPDRKDNVKYIEKEEDPRDYRVNFDKIKNILDFKLTQTVPDGIAEIINAIENKLIQNPNDSMYTNLELNEGKN